MIFYAYACKYRDISAPVSIQVKYDNFLKNCKDLKAINLIND